jgi:hypothetical protein
MQHYELLREEEHHQRLTVSHGRDKIAGSRRKGKWTGSTVPLGYDARDKKLVVNRHRQFGVLVTTSYVDSQAYREIKEDQHPIVVIAASDIVGILRSHGHAGPSAVESWLAPWLSTRHAIEKLE